MAFCANCGAQMDSGFCGRCGTAAGGAAPMGAQSAPSGGQSQAAGLPDNTAGALCYLFGWLTGLIFLLVEPYSRNRAVRFHAWQSILLSGAYIAIYIGLMILTPFLPGFVMVLLWTASSLLGLGFFVLWLLLLFKTYNGHKMSLPVIGPIAESKA